VSARRAWLWLPALGASALFLRSAGADVRPVLHEFIERFAGQEVSSPRTPPAAPSPAASGDGTRGSEPATAGTGTDEQAGSDFGADTFRIDSDPSRPDSVSYSDPFTPEVAPFKRSIAYDAVDADFELFVADRHLARVPLTDELAPTTEHFHAGLELELHANEPLRIPSVGPGARVRVAHMDPSMPFQILEDSAENWFVQSPNAGATRLVLQIAVDRRSFGTSLPDPSFALLATKLPPVPDTVKDSARQVVELLGAPKGAHPRELIAFLVDHFRRFRPSERRLAGHGAALYRQLAVSRLGVCRHRAYAFVVTALGLGIPARFVHNEAHAWVEVFEGELWQRIDLGGSAEHMRLDADARPRHVQPRDPFTWPEGSDPASALLDRSLSERANAPTHDAPGREPPAPAGDDDAPEPSPVAPAPAPSASAPPPSAPAVQVSIDTLQGRALRGDGFEVSGSVAAQGRPCPQVQVEVALRSSSGAAVALGTLLTDEHGQFTGRLAIPWSLPLGDYTLSAQSPACF
jgi:transglutaminase-like putative cysteine protease